MRGSRRARATANSDSVSTVATANSDSDSYHTVTGSKQALLAIAIACGTAGGSGAFRRKSRVCNCISNCISARVRLPQAHSVTAVALLPQRAESVRRPAVTAAHSSTGAAMPLQPLATQNTRAALLSVVGAALVVVCTNANPDFTCAGHACMVCPNGDRRLNTGAIAASSAKMLVYAEDRYRHIESTGCAGYDWSDQSTQVDLAMQQCYHFKIPLTPTIRSSPQRILEERTRTAPIGVASNGVPFYFSSYETWANESKEFDSCGGWPGLITWGSTATRRCPGAKIGTASSVFPTSRT